MSDRDDKAAASDPAELRREIEHTRRDLGDTVEALAQKADVKSQVKERVEERKETLRQTGEQAKSTVTTQASERGPRIAAGAIVALILLLVLRRRRR
jgi:MYXO-CTERM domain-containing protein